MVYISAQILDTFNSIATIRYGKPLPQITGQVDTDILLHMLMASVGYFETGTVSETRMAKMATEITQ